MNPSVVEPVEVVERGPFDVLDVVRIPVNSDSCSGVFGRRAVRSEVA